MKYYSEILDKVFDSVAELEAEETKAKAEISEKEALKKQVFAKLDEAINAMAECVEVADKLESMLSTKEAAVFTKEIMEKVFKYSNILNMLF